jgi:hypothetical protein
MTVIYTLLLKYSNRHLFSHYKFSILGLWQSACTFGQLRDKGFIGDAALVNQSYRFAGELVDVEQVLELSGTR